MVFFWWQNKRHLLNVTWQCKYALTFMWLWSTLFILQLHSFIKLDPWDQSSLVMQPLFYHERERESGREGERESRQSVLDGYYPEYGLAHKLNENTGFSSWVFSSSTSTKASANTVAQFLLLFYCMCKSWCLFTKLCSAFSFGVGWGGGLIKSNREDSLPFTVLNDTHARMWTHDPLSLSNPYICTHTLFFLWQRWVFKSKWYFDIVMFELNVESWIYSICNTQLVNSAVWSIIVW